MAWIDISNLVLIGASVYVALSIKGRSPLTQEVQIISKPKSNELP
jgi:hypothetical protein